MLQRTWYLRDLAPSLKKESRLTKPSSVDMSPSPLSLSIKSSKTRERASYQFELWCQISQVHLPEYMNCRRAVKLDIKDDGALNTLRGEAKQRLRSTWCDKQATQNLTLCSVSLFLFWLLGHFFLLFPLFELCRPSNFSTRVQ